MIIDCINCNKKFEVDSDLIPANGRDIQCGSCNHLWFFKKKKERKEKKFDTSKNNNLKDMISSNEKFVSQVNVNPINDVIVKPSNKIPTADTTDDESQVIEYKKKINITFSKFLSYILVIIISFIGFIIFLDTFKSPLYSFFPHLEVILFSLFETLKDVELFIIDLF